MEDNLARGGDFLLTGAAGKSIFSPEDFSDEQRQFAETTEEFIKKEVLPDLDRMEQQDFDLVVAKLRRCADLGLFLVDVPEDFGGMELDKVTSMLLAEKIAPAGSFSITYGGQTGIGLLPLVYYGTDDQKHRYLEKLTSGAWVAAYALTEPNSGSDALSARTTATLTPDGRHYILNGVKQFITNASFADLFTVFAKIDGKQFSAFLVEKGYAGLSIGDEEKKMGLKGSSTAQIFFDNVMVPVENLLGEPGKGHKIAFNALNIGRLKLAATAGGMAKGAFAEAAGYVTERKQFGRIIGDFGAIKEKLADMTAAIFASDSVVYRVAGMLDARIATLDRGGADYYERYQKAIEEYAIECAVAKVFCTDMLAEVVDEVVQVHGGYGYVSDYAAERYYRDERIQRIFEGTNEINRILIPTLLFRRSESAVFDLPAKIEGARTEVKYGEVTNSSEGLFRLEFRLLANLKNYFLTLLGSADQARDTQEVMLAVADMIISIFTLESVILRVNKVFSAASDSRKELLEGVLKIVSFEQAGRFYLSAGRCSAYLLKGESIIEQHMLAARLTAYPVEGLLEAKQQLADAAKDSGKYFL
ncbi:MAG: acyl-CoA dehydrogenase family protein [Desulfuromonadaceae bacterium]|nr:acyl-CoA dehydrogenase family protein [Desulfuromonadaceae bacterium]